MPIYEDVYPFNNVPSRHQMTRCLNVIDKRYITPDIIAQFKLEKGYGGWVMKGSLDKTRRLFRSFYKNLPTKEKIKFQVLFLFCGLGYVKNVLKNMSKLLEPNVLKAVNEEYNTTVLNVTKHVTPDDNELFSFTEQLADREETV